MFENRRMSANHRGFVVRMSPVLLLDATSSHHSGSRKYTVKTAMTSIAEVRETRGSRIAPERVPRPGRRVVTALMRCPSSASTS